MPIDRRSLLVRAAGVGLGAAASRPALAETACAAPDDEAPFRAITYNLHAFGPVAATEEGRRLANVLRPGGRLLDLYALELAQYEADVLCLQEAASEEQVAGLAERMGLHHVYFPGGHRDERGRTHPMFNGAVLTRHAILDRADCPSPSARADRKAVFSRHLGRVLLDTGDERWGDGGRVAVIGCHMLPAWENTTDVREAEIRAVGEAIEGDVEAGRSVLVLGDMNHRPDMPEYAGWAALGLTDAAAEAGVGATETIPSTKPEQRIDYVFARGPVAARLESCRALAEGRFRAHGGGPEAVGDYALSDHMPVLARFA